MPPEHRKPRFAQLCQCTIDMYGSQGQRVGDIRLGQRHRTAITRRGPGITQAYEAFAQQMRQALDCASTAHIQQPLTSDGIFNGREPPQFAHEPWKPICQSNHLRTGNQGRAHFTQALNGAVDSLREAGSEVKNISGKQIAQYLALTAVESDVSTGDS